MILHIHWHAHRDTMPLADRSMGFCLINNLAVALEYMRKTHGLKKFIILDFDAHYGNGTAEIFYQRPSGPLHIHTSGPSHHIPGERIY